METWPWTNGLGSGNIAATDGNPTRSWLLSKGFYIVTKLQANATFLARFRGLTVEQFQDYQTSIQSSAAVASASAFIAFSTRALSTRNQLPSKSLLSRISVALESRAYYKVRSELPNLSDSHMLTLRNAAPSIDGALPESAGLVMLDLPPWTLPEPGVSRLALRLRCGQLRNREVGRLRAYPGSRRVEDLTYT